MDKVTKSLFGKTSKDEIVSLYTITNNNSVSVGIIDFGGTIVFLKTPDKNKNLTDIVLGYDNIESYEFQDKYLGALIGRHGNRIKEGKFKLNGTEYPLYCNDGKNHLHGGKIGFDKKMWTAEICSDKLCLSYLSPDKEEGYPGNLKVNVTYSLTDDNVLTIDYKATTDADTVCNLTNHTYFNLAGHNSGTILNQKIQLFADYYTSADKELLPNGVISPVKGTPLDLTSLTTIGNNIDDSSDDIQSAGGYDHNWVINDYDGTMKTAAYACDETTGITLTASTNLPGIQFYTGNFLDGAPTGKGNTPIFKRCGFCLETQHFPNSMANDNFEKPILKKGDTYHKTTTYKLGTF